MIKVSILHGIKNQHFLSYKPKRIKVVYWWCYEHSLKPLAVVEILAVILADRSILTIYDSMSEQVELKDVTPIWGEDTV